MKTILLVARHFLFLVAIFRTLLLNAQIPNYLWAASGNGSFSETGNKLTSDDYGNVYAIGTFASSSLTLGSTTLTNHGGGDDLFVVKYDQSGNVIWAQSAGNLNHDRGLDICSSHDGGVYAVGCLYGYGYTIDFGNYTLVGSGSFDGFIVKYDSSGLVEWAKQSVGLSEEQFYAVSSDQDGNAYVVGTFYGTDVLFDSDTVHNYGSTSMFVAKYNSSGNVCWAKSFPGSQFGTATAFGVACDSLQHVYVTGTFMEIWFLEMIQLILRGHMIFL